VLSVTDSHFDWDEHQATTITTPHRIQRYNFRPPDMGWRKNVRPRSGSRGKNRGGAALDRRASKAGIAGDSLAIAPAAREDQLRAGLGEPDVGAALMQHQPAISDGAIEASLVFRRRAPQLIDERPVDPLDIDAVVLHRLEGVGQLSLL
jgi:hypothetical protein